MLELEKYKKDLENQGYKVIYIGLYGSQNYGVDDKDSDFDARAIVMPSLHDIIFRKTISKTIKYDSGTVDVKDIITYYDVIKKGNFSFIEAIDTNYYIGDKYIKKLFSQFRPNYKSILGAMYEKRKALTHPYPSKTKEFEKWGCDPKQYHHIIRLYDLLKSNIQNGFQDSFLRYESVDALNMIFIKRNLYGLSQQQMEVYSDLYIEKAKSLIPDDYKYEPIFIDEEIGNYIEKNLMI